MSQRKKRVSYIRGAFMNVSFDAPPLDFSFKEICKLESLKYEKQRKGRSKDRKPIEIKKDPKKKDKKENKNDDIEDDEDEQDENESDQDKDDEQKDKEGDVKEKKSLQVEKLIPPSKIHDLSNQHNISMAQNTYGQQKVFTSTEGVQKSKQKKVKLICSSLILMSNSIPNLNNFYHVVDAVMVNSHNLRWIDLSHNLVSELTEDFGMFPNLQSIYLHCNKIRDMNELLKLQNVRQLRTLTIHGNPLDQLPNFRIYIIGILNLKRLDTVLVTNKETDNAHVWKNVFMKQKLPIAPPEEEDLKKQSQDEDDM